MNLDPTSGTVNGNFHIGNAGTGSLTINSGSTVANTGTISNPTTVGWSAGATGTLTITGTASRYTGATGAQFDVAQPVLGASGGVATGTVNVLAGGELHTGQGRVGLSSTTSAESSVARVVVDGANSVWNLVRETVVSGTLALLNVANGQNADGKLTVSGGGKVRLDFTGAPNDVNVFTGVNVGTNSPTAQGSIVVTGAGSRLEMSGKNSFFNIGGAGNLGSPGGVGTVTVSAGGEITGVGSGASGEGAYGNGLQFSSIGRNGGSGTLNVMGEGGGAASTFRLAGKDLNGNAAFMQIGRLNGVSGNGEVNVTGGGRILIDARGAGVVAASGVGQPGAFVGVGLGSTGALSISGAGASPSTFAVYADTLAPYVGVGRDGATGTVAISGGGKLTINSTGASVPASTGFDNSSRLYIGHRNGGTSSSPVSSGTVTVSGAGSEIELVGATDRYIIIGQGFNAVGSLTASAGAKVTSHVALVGNLAGGVGTMTLNNATLVLDGVRVGGAAPGDGAGLGIGRAGATGTMNVLNGSTVTITSTGPEAGIAIGGTLTGVGGTGTMNVSGGSTISVAGPNASIRVGRSGDATTTGVGTMNTSGAGTAVSVTGTDGKFIVGAATNTIGTVTVGAGSSVSASSRIGVGHDGSANTGTGGIATMAVNGTVTAPDVYVGALGVLTGSGTINGNVTNYGVINPGNSPGTLTINGGYSGMGGQIVLEIEQQSDGTFITDKILFTNASSVDFGETDILFSFLGAADPNAFRDSGNFVLATFFGTAPGGTGQIPGTAFEDVDFSADSTAYNIVNFSFTANGAEFRASAVPLPGTLGLLLMGAAGLVLRRRATAA